MKAGRETCVKLFPPKPWSCQDTTDGLAVKHISDSTPQPVQVISHYSGKVSWQHLTLWDVCPDVCMDFVRTSSNSKAYVGFELTFPKKTWLLTGTLSIIWKEYLLPYVSQSITNSALTVWKEFWPCQFTSAFIRGWTGGWSDAQLLRTTVEDLYLSDWADVRYLATLPPRFPYRMSPDSLPHFSRDESGLPVSDISPSCLFSLGWFQF